MSTNYYAQKSGKEELHIGKSSHGWCFSLRVYPELGLNTLKDWAKFLKQHDVLIADEYGSVWTADEMLAKITDRKHTQVPPVWEMDQVSFRKRYGRWYRNPDDFMRQNHAVPGPNGLLRHKEDETTSHGEGTWDYCNYEFC